MLHRITDQIRDYAKTAERSGEKVETLEESDEDLLDDLDTELTCEFGRIEENQVRIYTEAMRLLREGIFDESPLRSPFQNPELNEAIYRDSEFFKSRNPAILHSHLFTQEGREHLKRVGDVFMGRHIAPVLEGMQCRLEHAPVKSISSTLEAVRRYADADAYPVQSRPFGIRPELHEKIATPPPSIEKLNDPLRARVVCKNLRTVEEVMARFGSVVREVVAVKNTFRKPMIDEKTEEPRPYMACNVTMPVGDETNSTFEIQFMTEAARRVGILTHPITVRKKIQLPQSQMDYLHSLAWGSHLNDLRNFVFS